MIDYLFLAYFLWRIYKGSINGIGKEIEHLFFTLLLLCAVMGIFIISELMGVIKLSLQTLLSSSSFWISLSSLLAAIFVFYFIRGKAVDYSEERLTGNGLLLGGAVIGLFRSIIMVYLFVMLLNFIPFGLFHESLQQSIIAKPLLNFIHTNE